METKKERTVGWGYCKHCIGAVEQCAVLAIYIQIFFRADCLSILFCWDYTWSIYSRYSILRLSQNIFPDRFIYRTKSEQKLHTIRSIIQTLCLRSTRAVFPRLVLILLFSSERSSFFVPVTGFSSAPSHRTLQSMRKPIGRAVYFRRLKSVSRLDNSVIAHFCCTRAPHFFSPFPLPLKVSFFNFPPPFFFARAAREIYRWPESEGSAICSTGRSICHSLW